jgi:hypothetical protein
MSKREAFNNQTLENTKTGKQLQFDLHNASGKQNLEVNLKQSFLPRIGNKNAAANAII